MLQFMGSQRAGQQQYNLICFLLVARDIKVSVTLFAPYLWTWLVGLVTVSCPILVTPWTLACQAPLPMGFSRQEYWTGLPFPFPGDLPDPGIKPGSPALQEDSLPTEL